MQDYRDTPAVEEKTGNLLDCKFSTADSHLSIVFTQLTFDSLLGVAIILQKSILPSLSKDRMREQLTSKSKRLEKIKKENVRFNGCQRLAAIYFS